MADPIPTLYNGLARGVRFLEHPNLHPQIAHPNATHEEMPNLKLENGWTARHYIEFPKPGGLHIAPRK